MVIFEAFSGPTNARGGLAVSAALALAAFAGAASAQTMWTDSAAFNAGFGRVADQENAPVDVQVNGVTRGLIQNDPSSIFAQTSFAAANAGGVADSFSGAGAAGESSSAASGSLNVVTEDDSEVSVNSTRAHSGNTTNGKQ
jgi:holdfast attachment protein HfaA